MSSKNPVTLFRLLLLLVAAGIINLLLLSAPVLLLSDARRIIFDPRITTFLFLVNSWCITEIVVSSIHSRPVIHGTSRQWLAPVIGILLLVVFLVSMAEIALSRPLPLGTGAGLGLLLLVAGGTLRCLSIHALGPFFLNEISLLPGQPLVTRGIYGFLRHPSELGTLCLAFGAAVELQSLAGFITCMAVLVPCITMRIRSEDNLLRSCHADAFCRYAREVPALVPMIRLARRDTGP